MNYDEFGFFNQQLASMLRDGIPLEGGVRQLCKSMRGGPVRRELEALAADLSNGTPLDAALGKRRLPRLYSQMVKVGAKSNDLPAILLMLADYYQTVSSISARLKGLLVYPVVVLLLALGLSFFLVFFFAPSLMLLYRQMVDEMRMMVPPGVKAAQYSLFVPPAFLILVLLGMVVAGAVPGCRRWFRWRLSPFRESSLAQLASAMALLLRGGCSLDEAAAMLADVEAGSRAGTELLTWRARLAEGHARFAEIAAGGRVFPPLFVWLVDNGGEDIAGGFGRAAEIYYARAAHRVEMMLYGVLPVSVLVLGLMLIMQLSSVAGLMIQLMQLLGGVCG